MSVGIPAPVLRQQFVNANGAPLSGGQLYSYQAGTTTPLATYTDSTLGTPNTNPVILDSMGSAEVWLGNNSYKFALYDSLSNLIWTVDNILSIQSLVAAIANFFQAYTTTATAAGTTTLVATSTYEQFFTGSTTQSVVLPVTSTLNLGQTFLIQNRSSGVVTVKSSGGNTIKAMEANSQCLVTCILLSGTSAASWDYSYQIAQGAIPAADGGTGVANANTITTSANATIGGTNSGDITLAAVGSSPNANGASLSGQQLNLQPFGTSAPGVVTASGGGTSNFLRADGTWAAPTASAPTNNYYSGYFAHASSWEVSSSGSFADGTNSGGNTLTQRIGNITVTAAGSNVCGITFTPAASSFVYWVKAAFTASNSGSYSAYQLTDSTNVVDISELANGANGRLICQGPYAPGTASAVTLKLQQLCGSANSFISTLGTAANAVEWSLVEIK